MRVAEIDIYLTLQCDLRCAHCFLGPHLGTGRHMDQGLLERLIRDARIQWQTERLTFLGGEPTLYPNIGDYLNQALEKGYAVRLVSNGGPGLERLLQNWNNPGLEVSISLDGLERTHDSIRATGSYRRALRSAETALALGLRVSAIISAQTENLTDIPELVRVLDASGFSQVTIHFVTDRGAATKGMVLSRAAWRSLETSLRGSGFGIPVRLEPTFTDAAQHLSCRVRDQRNLMFFPDGRVLHCSMFVDHPNAASYRWTQRGLQDVDSAASERSVCGSDTTGHCPAIHLVNPHLAKEAEDHGEKIDCIFHKLTLPLNGH